MGDRWFYYEAVVVGKAGKLFRFVFMNNNLQLARDHAEMVSRIERKKVISVSRLDKSRGEKLIKQTGIFHPV